MVQLRAFDASKSGAKLGVALLISLCTALLKKRTRGGLIIVGEINLGGSIEPIHNATTVAEIAVEKGASALLMPAAGSCSICRTTWQPRSTFSSIQTPATRC